MKRLILSIGLLLFSCCALAQNLPSGTIACETYNVGPTKTATQNTTGLQKCLNNAGHLTLLSPGTISVNPPFYLSSNTRFTRGRSTVIKQANGNNTNIWRNLDWISTVVTCTNGATAAAGTLTGYYVVTFDCGANAHGLEVGGYVQVKGDTTRQYLGIWRVDTVPSTTTFTILASGSAAVTPGNSAGTITVAKGDANITVEGGTDDYNGANNNSNYDYRAHAYIFNKATGVLVSNVRCINAAKFCFLASNAYNLQLRDVECNSASDCFHTVGPAYGISYDNLYGQAGDDFAAFNTSYAGFTQYALPAGGDDGGELIGYSGHVSKIMRGAAHGFALYADGSTRVSGVNVDGIYDLNNTLTYCAAIDLPASGGVATQSTGIIDVYFGHCYGHPVTNLVKIGGSAASASAHPAVAVAKLTIDGFVPGSTIAYHAVNVVDTSIGNFQIVNNYFDFNMTSVFDVVAYDANSTITTLLVKNNRFEASAGGSGAGVVAGNASGTLTTALIEGNSFPNFMHFGTATGAYVEMSGNKFTTYSAVRANYSASFNIHDNMWTTPGSTPPILLYGSGSTIALKTNNNDYGNATNWLQVGTAGGDTVIVNAWLKGNMATSGTDPGIAWTSSSYTFNLKGSDPSYFVDVAKFNGTIFPGATAYNSNSSTLPGIGPVVYQGGAWQRISTVVARVNPAQTFSGATTGNTLTNVTNMTFAVAANEEWTAEFILDIGAALATTGVKFAVTTPAAATVDLNAHVGADVVVLAGAYDKRTALSATAVDFTTTLMASAGDALAHIFLWVLNGANAGNVTLQMAQSTSAATAVVARSGSAMRANRVQ